MVLITQIFQVYRHTMRFEWIRQAELDQERWKETEEIQTRNPLRTVQDAPK